VWPHSFNCLKYLLSIIVVVASLAYPISATPKGEVSNTTTVMLVGLFLVTLYTTYWDVVNDWGLMQVLPKISIVDLFLEPKNKVTTSIRQM
jgi:hypothetical protein